MRPYTALRGAGFFALYFFALPGVFVALNERLGWPRWQYVALDALGAVLIVSGIGVCHYCASLFRSLGQGTPVPIEPPKNLIDSGLFRFSRNPMYVAYVAIGVGIFLVWGHAALLLYPLALLVLAQIYLVKLEEPRLAERFGAEYQEYCQRVPRWLRRGSAG
jgi:protein-S-isoprenylcysteine O-methyltransferase Ste14